MPRVNGAASVGSTASRFRSVNGRARGHCACALAWRATAAGWCARNRQDAAERRMNLPGRSATQRASLYHAGGDRMKTMAEMTCNLRWVSRYEFGTEQTKDDRP